MYRHDVLKITFLLIHNIALLYCRNPFRSLIKRQQSRNVWFFDILSTYITRTFTFFMRLLEIKIVNEERSGPDDLVSHNAIV